MYKNKKVVLDAENIDVVPYNQDLNQNAINEDHDGYDEGTQVFFVFLDVLGFSYVFDTEYREDDRNVYTRYKKVFEYFFDLLGGTDFYESKCEEDGLRYAGQTSDSLYFYTNSAEILIAFIKFYLQFSLYAMKNKVFFRGGIACGRIFRNESYQFYGDCVINAYRMESTVAKNPAVFIDEKTYNHIKDKGLDNIIETDGKNGRHYLKPFGGLEMEVESILNENGKEILEKVVPEEVLEVIKENQMRFEYDANLYSKYQFLADSFPQTEKEA